MAFGACLTLTVLRRFTSSERRWAGRPMTTRLEVRRLSTPRRNGAGRAERGGRIRGITTPRAATPGSIGRRCSGFLRLLLSDLGGYRSRAPMRREPSSSRRKPPRCGNGRLRRLPVSLLAGSVSSCPSDSATPRLVAFSARSPCGPPAKVGTRFPSPSRRPASLKVLRSGALLGRAQECPRRWISIRFRQPQTGESFRNVRSAPVPPNRREWSSRVTLVDAPSPPGNPHPLPRL